MDKTVEIDEFYVALLWAREDAAEMGQLSDIAWVMSRASEYFEFLIGEYID